MSSAGCYVDRLRAATVVRLDDYLLALDLTDTPHRTGLAASIGVTCLSARFTVQGVKGGTSGLGLLGNKLSIDLLTGVVHTPVIKGHKRAVDLNDMRRVLRCGENTSLLNTRTTARVRSSLIYITFRAVCVAENGLASHDVELADGIHFGATITLMAGFGFKRLL